MELSRRTLVKAGVWGAMLVPMARVLASRGTKPPGSGFAGAGYYLYPAWGEPRLYLVIPDATGLQSVEFRDPDSGVHLWTQSLSLTGDFAGKVAASG